MFDGRLLWFDGVEGMGGGGGGGVWGKLKLFHCVVRAGVYGILCA